MQLNLALLSSGLIVVFGLFLFIVSRKRFARLSFIAGFEKLNYEVGIFNRMRIVGWSKVYLKILGRLHIYPNTKPPEDAIERLFYAHAAAKLGLVKQSLIVFSNKIVIKRGEKIEKIEQRKFFPNPQPYYSALGLKANFEISGQKLFKQYSPSYVTYTSNDFFIKHIREGCIECLEVNGSIEHTLVLKTGLDKLGIKLSQTSDTIYFNNFGVYVEGLKKEFGTSMGKRTSELNLYITLGSNARVFYITGESKREVVAHVSRLRENNKLRYLLSWEQIEKNRKQEMLLEKMYNSKNIVGEGLRKKYLLTARCIPSIDLPTLVYSIENQEDFFEIIDNFEYYKESTNVVVLYSSQNSGVVSIVEAFLNKDEVKNLIENRIYFYFIDRMRVSNDVVYYLSSMHQSQYNRPKKFTATSSNSRVLVHTQINNNITSVFVTSKLNKSADVSIVVPLEISGIVKRVGGKLKVTRSSGRSYMLKLPVGVVAYDSCGNLIDGLEHSTDKVVLFIECKLKSYGERIFDVIKDTRQDLKDDVA